MIWLILQILLLLAIAALLGGLIGWALRGGMAASTSVAAGAVSTGGGKRLAELEAQLRAERQEVARLKSGADKKDSDADEEEEKSLAWRNRYLESRARFLEGKVAELEEARVTQTALVSAGHDVESDELMRIRWRNRYLEGRVRYLEEELVRGGTLVVAEPAAAKAAAVEIVETQDGQDKPALLDGPRNGVADDLKEIAGVGPKLEGLLNKLGVYHFDQIASWTEREIAWVNNAIAFKGRIERERWVEQANQLAQGVETDGKRKYKEGKHT